MIIMITAHAVVLISLHTLAEFMTSQPFFREYES